MAVGRAVAAAGRRAGAEVWRYRISIWIVVFTAAGVYGLASLQVAQDRLARVQDRLEHDAEVQEAEGCVNAWLRLEGSRSAISESINGVLALAFAPGVVDDEIPPERRAQIEATAAPIVADAQAELADPECDLDQARQHLAELQGAP